MQSKSGLLTDHTFMISRARASSEQEGLRSFFAYRDLGIAKATHGAFGAHVIRAKQRVDRPMDAHRHELGFQMVYVLKGRCEFWYEGYGDFHLEPGDCVYQPPGIAHKLVSCSDDCELLEVVMPAEFSTETVEEGR